MNNGYFKDNYPKNNIENIEDFFWKGGIRERLAPEDLLWDLLWVVEGLQRGDLPDRFMENFMRKSRAKQVHDACRDWVIQQCGFALYTKSYIKSLLLYMEERGIKRVVETHAGRGTLGPIMRKKGIDWICTDHEVPVGTEEVVQMDALEAVKHYQPQLVFASWINMNSEVDYDLACVIGEMGIRGLFVTVCQENIGSVKLWDGNAVWEREGDWETRSFPNEVEGVKYPYKLIRKVFEKDILQWWDCGACDETVEILPLN